MAEVIQSLWIGRPLSALERQAMTSSLRHGHDYHLYCYDDVGNVPAGVLVKDGNEILPASEIFCCQHGPARGSQEMWRRAGAIDSVVIPPTSLFSHLLPHFGVGR